MYLEGGDLLRLTGDALLRFGLQAGMDLSEETVVQLQEESRRYLVRSRGAHIAASRMVSKKELKDRLTRRGADAQAAEETADWLAELGAVDYAAYAGAVVRHYAASGYGRLRVQQELQRRGIDRTLWDDALRELPEGTICLNWGYSPEEKEDSTRILAQAGAIQYVCPGVCGWNQIMPRIADSHENIRRMAEYGVDYITSNIIE